MNESKPAEVFPPGDLLRDEIEERGWTQAEFAEIIGRSATSVNNIINARTTITPATAKLFAAALGTSDTLWMNLDAKYWLWREDDAPGRIALVARLRQRFPVRDMAKRGWIPQSDDPQALQEAVFRHFEIESLDGTPAFQAAAKRVRGLEEPLTEQQLAWLFRVKQVAATVSGVPQYSERRLRAALPNLQVLTSDPEEIRQVPRVLEECGVRLVIVEPLPGSKIDGVCFWLSQKEPVIGMSLRLDRIDNFWFCLRHEIEHVLRGDARVDSDMYAESDQPLDEAEEAANKAAEDFCVPVEELEGFIRRVEPLFSERRVVGFARRLGVHPGLVVGQLQWRTKRWDLLRKYLVGIRDYVTPYAPTDGYGRVAPI